MPDPCCRLGNGGTNGSGSWQRPRARRVRKELRNLSPQEYKCAAWDG